MRVYLKENKLKIFECVVHRYSCSPLCHSFKINICYSSSGRIFLSYAPVFLPSQKRKPPQTPPHITKCIRNGSTTKYFVSGFLHKKI